MVNIRRIDPAGTRTFMCTLTNGADVHTAIADIAREHEILTGRFDMLGGISAVDFTAYDFTSKTRLPALSVGGALEIVSGHGTIAQLDGQPHVHLHLVLAMRNAAGEIKVVAGHAARAVAFAIEITLTAFDGAPVQREDHAGTGLKLWALPPLRKPQ